MPYAHPCVHTAAAVRTHAVKALLAFRDAQLNKSRNWAKALGDWTCPTDPSDSDQPCDPCSTDWSGNWEFIHCRGKDARE